MKWIAMMIGLMLSVAGYSQQEGEENYRITEDGSVLVTAVDYFGADMLVKYNNKGERVYQERILKNVKTYALFDNGKLLEHGTIITHDENVNSLVEMN
jgi:hypothetical protein